METKDKLVRGSQLEEILQASTFEYSDYGKRGTATIAGQPSSFGNVVSQRIIVRDGGIYKIASIKSHNYAESLKMFGTYGDWFGYTNIWFFLHLNFRASAKGDLYFLKKITSGFNILVYDNNGVFDIYLKINEPATNPYHIMNANLELFGGVKQNLELQTLYQQEQIAESAIPGTKVWDASDNVHMILGENDMVYATKSDIDSMRGGVIKFFKKISEVFSYGK